MTSGAIATSLLAAALLPGAFFQWGYERNAGRYGIALKDRVLRVTGTSALFLAIFAWPLYWLFTNYWENIADRQSLPPSTFLVPLAYLMVPSLAGWLYGLNLKQEKKWAIRLAGSGRYPTAWDYALSGRKSGWIRCKLKSGIWVGGMFSRIDTNSSNIGKRKSYASGYPEPHELYLYPTVFVNQKTGEFLTTEAGEPMFHPGGLWMPGEDIAILEFIDSTDRSTDHAS